MPGNTTTADVTYCPRARLDTHDRLMKRLAAKAS